MKKILFLLPSLFLLTGCEGTVAEFAKRADDLLTEYQKKVDAQIGVSTTYYHNAAILLSADNRRVTLATLQADRNERSTELEADYRQGRKVPAHYRAELRNYADAHYDQQKAWLTADLDPSDAYLAQLVALEQDKATIDAFSKILKNLAQPRSARDEAADIKNFIGDSKTEFDKLVCKDTTGQIASLGTAPAGETPDQKKTREDKLAAEKQLKTDHKCT